ncbi:MAG: hypothetical protein ABL996_16605 [Micropepsaceae bacterium]
MFRIGLIALLTLALNVAAIAHCRVGAVSMDVASVGESQSGTQDHQSDCDRPDKRVCDAMVQLTAPDQPSVAPALFKSAFASVVLAPSIVATPAIAPSLWQWRPPPNGGSNSFKTIYARTGRFLV